MTPPDNGVDYVSAPANYADLFAIYYKYVVALVRRNGVSAANTEDVASEILCRFMERDFLTVFDPSLVFVYDGKERPARFKQFLSKFVLSYVRGMRDKERAIAEREPLLCDVRVGDDKEDTWVELYGCSEDSFEVRLLEEVYEEQTVQFLRDYLKSVPRRNRVDRCDLPALFDAVIAQIRATGELNINALHQQFGISVAAMHSWVWWLRENLAAALDRPVPAKRQQRRKPEASPSPDAAPDTSSENP